MGALIHLAQTISLSVNMGRFENHEVALALAENRESDEIAFCSRHPGRCVCATGPGETALKYLNEGASHSEGSEQSGSFADYPQ
jgi:hypothetical protein